MEKQRVTLRGLEHTLYQWGDPEGAPLLCLHGWMDTGASFAPLARALPPDRRIVALDWRGFGESARAPDGCYWFPEYLADLDALLDQCFPEQAPVVLGHSMGGNVACLYAGVRPERLSGVISVEGFGMPATDPNRAPERYGEWLDSLKAMPTLPEFDSFGALARYLRKRDPWLDEAIAHEMARGWGRETGGKVRLQGDPCHKRPNPVLYRLEEAMSCWRRIQVPVLWVYGEESGYWQKACALPDWADRVNCFSDLEMVGIAEASHAVHQDQPDVLAARICVFLRQLEGVG